MKGAYTITIFFVAISLFYGCKKEKSEYSFNTKINDVDGNTYNTVTIGIQVFLAENLKTTKYQNGDPIPTTVLNVSAESAPKYQWAYADDESNVTVYGRLYTWYTVTDKRNICPTGWHVPTYTELGALKMYLGGESIGGGKLKETETTHWLSPNTGATNETGFTALPGGYRNLNGDYVSLGLSCYLWSSSLNPYDLNLGWGQGMYSNSGILLEGGYNKPNGVSVRCIKE